MPIYPIILFGLCNSYIVRTKSLPVSFGDLMICTRGGINILSFDKIDLYIHCCGPDCLRREYVDYFGLFVLCHTERNTGMTTIVMYDPIYQIIVSQ